MQTMFNFIILFTRRSGLQKELIRIYVIYIPMSPFLLINIVKSQPIIFRNKEIEHTYVT